MFSLNTTNRDVMNKTIFILTVLLGGLTAAPGYAQYAITAGVETVSEYVWRGYALTDGATVQPALDVAWEARGLTLSFWGSAAMVQRADFHGADEFDVTLNYAAANGAWGSLDAGVIFYTFPSQGRFSFSNHTSPEFYVALAPSLPLSPEVFLAYDMHLGGDAYAALSVGHSVSVAGHPMALGITAGYNNGQFEAASGFSHLDVSLSTELHLGPVGLAPRVVYVRSFENTGNAGNRLFFGVGFGV